MALALDYMHSVVCLLYTVGSNFKIVLKKTDHFKPRAPGCQTASQPPLSVFAGKARERFFEIRVMLEFLSFLRKVFLAFRTKCTFNYLTIQPI